jgi:AraC-like DNA-binding protein
MKDDFEQARVHLAARIARWTAGSKQYDAPIAGLCLWGAQTSGLVNCMLEPAIAIAVQGTKRTRLGSEVYLYDRHRFLITSLDLPVIMEVENASPGSPYLGAILRLDVRMISELMIETPPQPPSRESVPDRGIVLGETTVALFAAFDRLIGLLEEPELIPVLAPLIQREIYHRILRSDVGRYLWQMASIGSQGHRIGQAIDWLKANFREPLRVQELAARVGMSPSRFHHHFRHFTSMSPLQFQKWLRLAEARRLMILQGMNPSMAAYEVGYDSPSQFSREYTRLFGTPPRRDVDGILRQAAS